MAGLSPPDLIRAGYKAHIHVKGYPPQSSAEILRLIDEYLKKKGEDIRQYFPDLYSDYSSPTASMIFAHISLSGVKLSPKQQALCRDMIAVLQGNAGR